MTAIQLEAIRIARLQLIDLGDERTAAALEWALTAQPDPAPPTAGAGAGVETPRSR